MVSLLGHANVICQLDVWYFGANSESDVDFGYLIIQRSELKMLFFELI